MTYIRETNDMNELYERWRAAATSENYTPIPQERIDEMFLCTTQHGPPNCWTGTTGTMAAMIRELLRERERLIEGM